MGVREEDYERLSISFKAMGAGLWDYDIESDRLFCNARWYEILGLDQTVAPILSIDDFKPHIHPDDVRIATEVDLSKMSQLLANDERYHMEFRIIRPTGEVRWVRSVACLVENRATRHLRAVGCITDITEFRAIEPPAAGALANPSDGVAAAAEQPERGTDFAPPVERTYARLSEKERDCLMWVSMGKTAWETAAIVGRSQRTIEFHLKNVMIKLGASNKVHAAAIAIRNGLL